MSQQTAMGYNCCIPCKLGLYLFPCLLATVAELAEKMKMTEDEVKDIMKLALDAITVNGEGAVSGEQKEEE